MTLHQRKTHTHDSNTTGEPTSNNRQDEERATRPSSTDTIDVDGKKSKIVSQPSFRWMPRRGYIIAALVVMQLLFTMVAVYKTKTESISHVIAVSIASTVASLPILLALASGLGVDTSPPYQPHQIIIPLAVVGTIVGNQLPTYFTSGFTAGGLILFGLASRPVAPTTTTTAKNDVTNLHPSSSPMAARKHHMQMGPLSAVAAAFVMTITLLIENFFVWIVSATYYPSQQMSTLPRPLQDNGKIALHYLVDTILKLHGLVKLRNAVNVQWALVTGLGLSVGAVVLHGHRMRRSLPGFAVRSLMTMAIARFIRTTSFLITVLPSQNPKCYFSHFPYPPPNDWMSWIMVGFTPQSHGGCNDLIISGHATVTSTLACMTTSVVGKPLFTTALWMLVAMDYMVEVYEGFHYSVDMWLGAVLVNFIWAVLAPVDIIGGEQVTSLEADAEPRFQRLEEVTSTDIFHYALPGMGAYLQVTKIFPERFGVFTIVMYLIFAVSRVLRIGFDQYSQHVLFCLLYMALGIYL